MITLYNKFAYLIYTVQEFAYNYYVSRKQSWLAITTFWFNFSTLSSSARITPSSTNCSSPILFLSNLCLLLYFFLAWPTVLMSLITSLMVFTLPPEQFFSWHLTKNWTLTGGVTGFNNLLWFSSSFAFGAEPSLSTWPSLSPCPWPGSCPPSSSSCLCQEHLLRMMTCLPASLEICFFLILMTVIPTTCATQPEWL